MDRMLKRCVSCGKETMDYVEFPCPNCSTKIVRCNQCRDLKNKYVCECGFEGP